MDRKPEILNPTQFLNKYKTHPVAKAKCKMEIEALQSCLDFYKFKP